MPRFGARSEQNLIGVHPDLARTCRDVIEWFDFSVVEGFRTAARQAQLYAEGKSQRPPGSSLHESMKNGQPYSRAVDIYPYPLDPKEWAEFVRIGKRDPNLMSRWAMLHGAMIQAGRQNGIVLRCGLDWDRDGQALGAGFLDAPHIEIVGTL